MGPPPPPPREPLPSSQTPPCRSSLLSRPMRYGCALSSPVFGPHLLPYFPIPSGQIAPLVRVPRPPFLLIPRRHSLPNFLRTPSFLRPPQEFLESQPFTSFKSRPGVFPPLNTLVFSSVTASFFGLFNCFRHLRVLRVRFFHTLSCRNGFSSPFDSRLTALAAAKRFPLPFFFP